MRAITLFFFLAAWACNSGPGNSTKKAHVLCPLLDSFYLQYQARWNTKGLHDDVSRLEKASGVNSLMDCGKDGCFYDSASYLISDYVVWAKKLECACRLPDSLQQHVIAERAGIVAERRKRAIPIELQ